MAVRGKALVITIAGVVTVLLTFSGVIMASR